MQMITSPDQSNQLSTYSNTTFKSDLITAAIAMSPSTKLTEYEIAELMGFNDEEIKLLSLYWDSAYNKAWLYLSDDLILGNLTNEVGRNALSHFFTRTLIPFFKEGEEYKEVKSSDRLVKNTVQQLMNNI